MNARSSPGEVQTARSRKPPNLRVGIACGPLDDAGVGGPRGHQGLDGQAANAGIAKGIGGLRRILEVGQIPEERNRRWAQRAE